MPRDLLESANTQPRDLLAAAGPAQSAASMPVNSLHAAIEAFSDGFWGGFDDEIGAAMYSPIEATKNWAQGKGFSIPESYRYSQQRMDARKAARRERYPVTSTLGSIAGGSALGAGAMRAGLTTIGRLAPVKGAAVEGGLYGALYGAGEASPGERLKGAFTGGLVGAGTGALAGKIGQSIMNRGSSAQLQPAEAIKIQKNALYDASEKARVMIRPAPIKRAVQNLRLKMASQVKNERLYAETRDILQYLDDAASRGPMTLREVDELRQVVGDTIASANLREKRTLGMVKSAIDDFLDNLSPKDATGATKEGVELLKQAREMNVVMSKQRIVEEIVENAKNQATGFENGLRVHFRALAKNPKKFGKFSKAEQDAIRKVIRGGPVENVLRAFAWFSPQKTLGAVFTGLTAAEGGMGPASAVAAGGMAATRLAEGATRKNVNALEMLIQGQGRRDLPLLARQAIPVLSGTASREMEQR